MRGGCEGGRREDVVESPHLHLRPTALLGTLQLYAIVLELERSRVLRVLVLKPANLTRVR